MVEVTKMFLYSIVTLGFCGEWDDDSSSSIPGT